MPVTHAAADLTLPYVPIHFCTDGESTHIAKTPRQLSTEPCAQLASESTATRVSNSLPISCQRPKSVDALLLSAAIAGSSGGMTGGYTTLITLGKTWSPWVRWYRPSWQVSYTTEYVPGPSMPDGPVMAMICSAKADPPCTIVLGVPVTSSSTGYSSGLVSGSKVDSTTYTSVAGYTKSLMPGDVQLRNERRRPSTRSTAFGPRVTEASPPGRISALSSALAGEAGTVEAMAVITRASTRSLEREAADRPMVRGVVTTMPRRSSRRALARAGGRCDDSLRGPLWRRGRRTPRGTSRLRG